MDHLCAQRRASVVMLRLAHAVGRTQLAEEMALDELTQLRETAAKQFALIGAQRERLARDAPARPALRFMSLAASCLEADLGADVIVGHGVETLVATICLARKYGSRAICDVIETPSWLHRSLPCPWADHVSSFIDAATDGYLAQCDALLAGTSALAERLAHYGPPVTVIENYRDPADFVASNDLRTRVGLQSNGILLLSISTHTSGIKPLLQALAQIPRAHLVILGHVKPDEYAEEMQAFALQSGVASRFHILPPVPYEDLLRTIACADVGLIPLDTKIVNNSVALPNRVFDYIAAGVPICAPPIPDIARLVRQHRIGWIMNSQSSNEWSKGVQVILNAPLLRGRVREAAKVLTWDSRADLLLSALGNPASVTFVGYNSLHINQRTIRMCRSLRDRGVKVKLCTGMRVSAPEAVSPVEGVELLTVRND